MSWGRGQKLLEQLWASFFGNVESSQTFPGLHILPVLITPGKVNPGVPAGHLKPYFVFWANTAQPLKAQQNRMLFLSWWKQVLNTGLQDGKWSCIFMWLFCNSRITFNKDPLQLHQYFIPFGCWWPQGFPYHVKLSKMEFFTLYSRWNFLLLLLSISLTYFRNDSSGFIPNIAAMTQPLFLVLDSEMHLLLLHSLRLCNFPL